MGTVTVTRDDGELSLVGRPTTLPTQRPAAEPLRGADPDGEAGTGTELRDRLTRTHLRSVGEAPEASEVLRFRRNWWDGAAHVPALVVRLPVSPGRGHRRCRLVDVGGQVVALPVAGWRARRTLRRLRRPVAVDSALLLLATKGADDPRLDGLPRVTVVPPPRADHPHERPSTALAPTRPGLSLVVITQQGDVVACTGHDCAGLVPIAPPGRIVSAAGICSYCGHG